MEFIVLAEISAVLSLLLGVGWLFAGEMLLKRWQIEPTSEGLMLGRRIGALYVGQGALFLLARSIPKSPALSALCAASFVTLVLSAGLGLMEFKAHRAGPGILLSAAVEAALALCFASVLLA